MCNKKITFERIVQTAAHGTEKEAKQLCYDILFEDIEDIVKKPQNPFDNLTAEDERLAKHLGMTYEEFVELKKLYF